MTPVPQMPRDPSGSSPLVETIKRLIAIVRGQRVIPGPGLKVSYTKDATTIELSDTLGRGSGGQGNVPRWG